MKLKNIKIGLGITGSFCNFKYIKDLIYDLQEHGAEVYPILSFVSKNTDTRFYKASEFVKMIEETTQNKIIDTIEDAEPIRSKRFS